VRVGESTDRLKGTGNQTPGKKETRKGQTRMKGEKEDAKERKELLILWKM